MATLASHIDREPELNPIDANPNRIENVDD
jgi:hypothetical protein